MSDIDISQPSHSTRQYQTGILYALIGTALFSIKSVLIKLAYAAGGDATAIMSLRAISSLPFYVLIFLWLARKSEVRVKVRRYSWQAILVGILGYYFATAFDISALHYISAQLERLLIFLYPTFVVFLSWIFLKERPSRVILSSIVIGYVGVSLIMAHDIQLQGDKVWFGAGLALLSAFVFATYLILSKSIITKMGSDLFTSIGMSSAAVVIMVQYYFHGIPFDQMSSKLIWIGIATGIFCTVLPSYFMAAAMARLSPSVMGLSGNIGPVTTTVFAIIILNEQFTVYHFIGMSLVIWSVVRLKRKKR
ncbi:DMT family transporter [Vibrio sp.]|nr:DMT family transporter [Vibrio sp.]